jgi:hypothetical protein
VADRDTPTRQEVQQAIDHCRPEGYPPELLPLLAAARLWLDEHTCDNCNGTGEISLGRLWRSGETVQIKSGTNIETMEVCPKCGGTGQKSTSSTYERLMAEGIAKVHGPVVDEAMIERAVIRFREKIVTYDPIGFHPCAFKNLPEAVGEALRAALEVSDG